MGWFREYLDDVKQMQEEQEAREMGYWLVGYGILAAINLLFLMWGFEYWRDGDYLKSIGSFLGCILFIVIPAIATLKGGCIGVVSTILIIVADVYMVAHPAEIVSKIEKNNTVKSTSINQIRNSSNANQLTPEQLKTYPYLQDLNNITARNDLTKFYFTLSGKFNQNEMGLKGNTNQIKTSNKLMGNIYHYLAKSSIYGNITQLDSIRNMINKSKVTDSRKKKALEELDIGVDVINSFK